MRESIDLQPPARPAMSVRRASPDVPGDHYSWPAARNRQENQSPEMLAAIRAARGACVEAIRTYEPARSSFGELESSLPLDVHAFRVRAAQAEATGNHKAASEWTSRAERLARWNATYLRIERLRDHCASWIYSEKGPRELAQGFQAELKEIIRSGGLENSAFESLARIAGEVGSWLTR